MCVLDPGVLTEWLLREQRAADRQSEALRL
jgi:hypothetical protein